MLNALARVRTTAILLAVAAWLTILAATHHGARSSYTYIAQLRAESLTRVVNPDAVTAAYPLTRFLYDGTPPRWEKTANARLPLHSFLAAMAISFVRNYLVANTILNVAALVLLAYTALAAARRFGLHDAATLGAVLTAYSLPPVVAYIGQPLQYVVGTVINSIVLLTALTLPPDQLRRPLVAGGLLAILSLNYDWYVWAAALVTWLVVNVRLRPVTAAGTVLLGLLPAVAWTRAVEFLGDGKVSTQNQDAFRDSILFGWSEILTGSSPVVGTLLALEVGARAAVLEVLGFVWWPLLAAAAVALWSTRAALPVRSQTTALLALLAAWFFIEQLAGAAMLVENHPRRALPVVFAFACGWCWLLDRAGRRRPWRIAFGFVIAATLLLAHVDTLTGKPGYAVVHQGEAVRDALKVPMTFAGDSMPRRGELAPEQRAVTARVGAARTAEVSAPLVVAQVFLAAATALLFVLASRASLLPGWSAIAFAALWAASIIARFL